MLSATTRQPGTSRFISCAAFSLSSRHRCLGIWYGASELIQPSDGCASSIYTRRESAISAYWLTSRWNAFRRVINGGQVQLPKFKISGLFPFMWSRIRLLHLSPSCTTSVFGAAYPRCADLKKSNLCPCQTAFSDSQLNILFESETHSGGSSGLPSCSLIFSNTFFLMHRKSSNHSMSAAMTKRGSRIKQTTAFFSALTATPIDCCISDTIVWADQTET